MVSMPHSDDKDQRARLDVLPFQRGVSESSKLWSLSLKKAIRLRVPSEVYASLSKEGGIRHLGTARTSLENPHNGCHHPGDVTKYIRG